MPRAAQPLFYAAALSVAAFAAAAESGDMVRWKPAICGARGSCEIVDISAAGRGAGGAALAVAKVHLGIEDKSQDAPDEGCIEEDSDRRDGGVEYWLIEGKTWPRQILKLCNDGYGASGVGGDKVEIGDNSVIHTQSGGSADRWETMRVMQLSPSRTKRVAGCSFLASDPLVAAATETDVATLTTRVVAIDDQWERDDQPATLGDAMSPCPQVGKAWVPEPAPGLLAGLAIPLIALRDFPSGTALGSCATHIGTEARPGFLVLGTLDPQRRPELWIAALDRQTLVVQVFEPRPSQPGASWVVGDHIEVWTTGFDPQLHNRPNPKLVKQIGVGLDGSVHRGVGNPVPPKVKHWDGRDDRGRPVNVLLLRWADKEALAPGVSVVYSQAENARQERLLATAGIVKNRPAYLPPLQDIPVGCGIAGGRLDTAVSESPVPPN
jgi:hypothetical protein